MEEVEVKWNKERATLVVCLEAKEMKKTEVEKLHADELAAKLIATVDKWKASLMVKLMTKRCVWWPSVSLLGLLRRKF